MAVNKSLPSFFMRRLLLITFTAFCCISLFILLYFYYEYRLSSQQIRTELLLKYKSQIKDDVDYAYEQIAYARDDFNDIIHEKLRHQVDIAYELIANIYDNQKDKLSEKQLKEFIVSTLRPVRFFNGRGYYFIAGKDNYLHLWPLHPEREGTYIPEIINPTNNRPSIVQEIKNVLQGTESSILRCKVGKPGEPEDKYYSKLLYVRRFSPYDWFLGTGDYIDEVRQEVQVDVLHRLEVVCSRISDNIFAGTYEGISLLGPAKGKNVLDGGSAGAAEVVSKIIECSKDGGGYVEYTMPSFSAQSGRLKLSYVRPVPGWNWYVGSGVFLDTIDAEIELFEKDVLDKIYLWLSVDFAIFFGIFVFAFLMARRFTISVSHSTNRFAKLMHNAASSGDMIDVDDFDFSEFQYFAKAANAMLLARRRSEQNLSATLDSIAEGVISTDMTARVVAMNPVACRLTGISFSKSSNLDIRDIVRFTDSLAQEKRELPFAKAIAGDGEVVSGDDLMLESVNGELYHIDFSLAPVKVDGGEMIGTVLVFRDRSDEYHMQQKLRQGQKLESIGQLAGGIAHDFNNMLGGIIGGAELLESRVGDDERCSRHLGMIMRSAERAADLAGKLLAFARRQVAVFCPVDLNEVLDNTVDVLSSTIDKRVEIELAIGKSPCRVFGDETMLQGVFLNIGINAAHAMPEGGKLCIKTESSVVDENNYPNTGVALAAGEYVDVEICDTGCGIAPDVIPHIFEPFFTTKEQGKGTGLGLAAAYGTVRQHKGIITVYSELGKGACFHVILPLVRKENETVFKQTGVINGTGTILLIDDEPVVRATGKALLEECGYNVILAENGKDGVEQFEEHQQEISLVIMDMIMPIMNGRDCFL